MRIQSLCALVVLLVVTACTTPDLAPNTVMKRAPHDLDCPVAEVTASEIAPRTVKATGCGHRATYNCRCIAYFGAMCLNMACEKEQS